MSRWNMFYFPAMILIAMYVFLIAGIITKWLRLNIFVPTGSWPTTKISVVVPVRNEAANIRGCLKCLSVQDYPPNLLEIIVVDDHSSDTTHEEVMDFIKNQNPSSPHAKGMKLLRLGTTTYGKKGAITRAINQASGEMIVTTDGDCRMGPHWLKTIASYYETHRPKMIAGPVLMDGGNTFLEKFQALEATGLTATAGAAIAQGRPLLCNGANLAYRKDVFLETGGFTGIDHTASGDDVLLMEKIQARYPGGVHYLNSPCAYVTVRPLQSLADFMVQRMRWVSKIRFFKQPHALTISLLTYMADLTTLAVMVLLFVSPYPDKCLIIIGMKAGIDFLFLILTTSHFHNRHLLWWFIPAEVFKTIYVTAAGLLGNMVPVDWKGYKTSSLCVLHRIYCI